MKTYVVLRRCAWRSIDDLPEAMERAESALQWAPETPVGSAVTSLPSRTARSAPLACTERRAGGGPRPRRACGLPIDEIVAVLETLVVEPDPVEAATLTKGGRNGRVFRKRLALARRSGARSRWRQVVVALASGGSDLAAARERPPLPPGLGGGGRQLRRVPRRQRHRLHRQPAGWRGASTVNGSCRRRRRSARRKS